MPPSKSAVDRAGENIRAAVRADRQPAPEDLAVVEEYRATFGQAIAEIQIRLKHIEEMCRRDPRIVEFVSRMATESGYAESAFLSVSARPKTLGSIVAKLGRETIRLSQMQDLVGGRIVFPIPALQDAVIAGSDTAPVIRVTDTRRDGDRHGYRAVHVVVDIDGRPAEIQYRTPLQQLWRARADSPLAQGDE